MEYIDKRPKKKQRTMSQGDASTTDSPVAATLTAGQLDRFSRQNAALGMFSNMRVYIVLCCDHALNFLSPF